MNNHQKGAANTVLVIIIVLLLAAVAYFGFIKKPAMAPADTTTTPVTTTTTSTTNTSTTNPSTTTVSVAGMQQYTDTTLGFSFWYPATWKVTASTATPPNNAQLASVTIVKTLAIGPSGQSYPSITIEEAKSTTRTITDTGGAGPSGPITYFFDTTSHLWMTTSSETNKTSPANISINTMGGLHMFGGTSRFDTSIVPLSADNFVVVSDGGATNATPLTKTIVATDPSVATPLSATEQTAIIQQEQAAIAPSSATVTVTNSTDLPAYISNADGLSVWPPVIKTSTAAYSCTPGKGNADMTETTTQTVVNGRTYCIHSTSDGYAGGAGIDRTYKTAATGGGTKVADFTLLYSDCGVYEDNSLPAGGTKYNQCQNDEATFNTNINAIIDSLMK